MVVRDLRHLTDAEEIFAAIVEHIRQANNSGHIRSTISIFAPDTLDKLGIRIWNSQFIRYAGYRQADGTIKGDPDQIELTKQCQDLGWSGQGTAFDVLPLVIQPPNKSPQWFEIPSEIVLEVPITHPEYAWFEELELKWLAIPGAADWRLEIGGISYSCAPFNGWYMSAEVGTRNLGDANRYNMLPVIAERLGLDMGSKLSLWKDQALIELNRAVLYSYKKHGVRMVDHHTASAQFMKHRQKEANFKRFVPANWSKIISPISPSTTEVFYQEMENVCIKPNFFPQPSPWQMPDSVVATTAQNDASVKRCPFHSHFSH